MANLPAAVQNINGRRVIVSGADTTFFGPMQPLPPMAQAQTMGRAFDYPFGINLYREPKQLEGLGFRDLRALADNCTLVRLAIETRKDQIEALTWSIKPRDEKKKPDRRCKKLEEFFRYPDKERSFGRWLRELTEDLLVIDAPSIYARRTLGGDIYALEIVDGGTIKRLLNADGRTPMAPDPAYQQIIKGAPTADYTTEELIYYPRNTRSHKIYGFSPVEQLLTIINIATRRDTHKLTYYTKGTIPDGFLTAPENWNLDQVEKFQTYLNDMLAGDLEARRQMLVLPNGIKFESTKEALLKDEMDEWLARVICYCFSLNAQAFIKMMNRATSEVAQDASLQEGLEPLKLWVCQLMNYILMRFYDAPDLCFVFESKAQIKPLEQAQTDKIYLDSGVKLENEVRDQLGLDPLDEDELERRRAAKQSAQLGLFGNDEEGEETTETNQADQNTIKKPAKGGKKAKATESEVAKRKKKVQLKEANPINRDTETTANAVAVIHGAFTKTFAKAKAHTIVALTTRYGETTKAAEENEARAVRMLADIQFGDYDDLPKQINGELQLVAGEGQTLAFEQIGVSAGIDLNLMNELAHTYAQTRGAALVKDIADATRLFLQSAVTQAIENGLSTNQLADLIAANYAFSDARAERIARTEVALAQTNGNMQAYRASGVVMQKRWAIGMESCPKCVANAEQGPIALDARFKSGDDCPPAHPNCVCDVIPIVIDETKPEPDGTP